MKFKTIILLFVCIITFSACSKGDKMNSDAFRELTPEEERVIVHKGTERPFTGEYYKHSAKGTYNCKRCNAPLYRSNDKFDSGCGWPSFDDEIEGAVERKTDADGRRTEILCAKCGAHLGHVFKGEGFTQKNTRHCVNSISLVFEPEKVVKTAYFSAGCFWGVEYMFEKKKGVIKAVSGYMGGTTENPDYYSVCAGGTGHLETVEVTYDANMVSYDELVKYFFETHDPTQKNGQGPDIGSQYKSAVFVHDDSEKATVEKYIKLLAEKGYIAATAIKPMAKFWSAEEYHQNYYKRKNSTPYCHSYVPKF